MKRVIRYQSLLGDLHKSKKVALREDAEYILANKQEKCKHPKTRTKNIDYSYDVGHHDMVQASCVQFRCALCKKVWDSRN